EEGASHAPLAGYEFLPAEPGWWSLWKEPDGRRAQVWTAPARPFITKGLRVVRDIVAEEYAFLKANAHARTKFTIPAPSWHRIFWHPEYSRAVYPTPEDFVRAVAAYLREEVVPKLIALGGDYIQMDAPNYAQWHVDAGNRAAFEAWGHDMTAELTADAEIDNAVFEGVGGVTRAIHICRGNAPGGRWLADGGYERIAGEVSPRSPDGWGGSDRCAPRASPAGAQSARLRFRAQEPKTCSISRRCSPRCSARSGLSGLPAAAFCASTSSASAATFRSTSSA